MNRMRCVRALCVVCVVATAGYAVMASQRAAAVERSPATRRPAPRRWPRWSPGRTLCTVFAHRRPVQAGRGRAARCAGAAVAHVPSSASACTLASPGCASATTTRWRHLGVQRLHVRSDFQPGAHVPAGRRPVRVRVAPDGGFGSATLFVTGHSYSDGDFSTATTVVDTRSGATVGNLEQFSGAARRRAVPGARLQLLGRDVRERWQQFYATLGTGGKTTSSRAT